ncbi:MAG: hypothetical protein AVDCRST_MAG49-2345, partial [uncultured Thermomicrobiales bacterium]
RGRGRRVPPGRRTVLPARGQGPTTREAV